MKDCVIFLSYKIINDCNYILLSMYDIKLKILHVKGNRIVDKITLRWNLRVRDKLKL